MVMERSASESAKDKAAAAERSRGSGGKGHKRQRSWAGNKVLDVETAGKTSLVGEINLSSYMYIHAI